MITQIVLEGLQPQIYKGSIIAILNSDEYDKHPASVLLIAEDKQTRREWVAVGKQLTIAGEPWTLEQLTGDMAEEELPTATLTYARGVYEEIEPKYIEPLSGE